MYINVGSRNIMVQFSNSISKTETLHKRYALHCILIISIIASDRIPSSHHHQPPPSFYLTHTQNICFYFLLFIDVCACLFVENKKKTIFNITTIHKNNRILTFFEKYILTYLTTWLSSMAKARYWNHISEVKNAIFTGACWVWYGNLQC